MSNAFVVDASMAFAWVRPSQASAQSDALLDRIEQGAMIVVSPPWFPAILSRRPHHGYRGRSGLMIDRHMWATGLLS